MKKAVLALIILAALPLTALLAQSDPATPSAADPHAYQADPAQPVPPSDPAAANPADPSAAPRDAAVTDPDAVNDPDQNRELPATASHGPLILLMGILAIGMFLVLKVFRRRSVDVS